MFLEIVYIRPVLYQPGDIGGPVLYQPGDMGGNLNVEKNEK